jgi:hypothetical protein
MLLTGKAAANRRRQPQRCPVLRHVTCLAAFWFGVFPDVEYFSYFGCLSVI